MKNKQKVFGVYAKKWAKIGNFSSFILFILKIPEHLKTFSIFFQNFSCTCMEECDYPSKKLFIWSKINSHWKNYVFFLV